MPSRVQGPSRTPSASIASTHWGVATIKGRRAVNQDRVCALSTWVFGAPGVLLVVADGMGGMEAGEQAAQLAVDTAGEHASRQLPSVKGGAPEIRGALAEMVREANRRIWRWGSEHGAEGRVGSTIACCLLWQNRYLVAHVGDSRCYYVNRFGARCLTIDHTRAQQLVSDGAMTPEAARGSLFGSQLTNSLGEPFDPVVDLSPSSEHLAVMDEPCALVVCSDGLHSQIGETDLACQLAEGGTIETACQRLVGLAFDRGSTDNISLAAAYSPGFPAPGPGCAKSVRSAGLFRGARQLILSLSGVSARGVLRGRSRGHLSRSINARSER